MAGTKPTGEQIRFRSSNTGEHVLDDYLEATEKGGRTLPDMLDDIFDNTGQWDQSLFQFRLNPSTNTIEFRNGTYVDPEASWETLTPFFRDTGAFNSGTTYNTYDLITDTNTDVYLVTTGGSQTFATLQLMRDSANTSRIFDISTANQHKLDAQTAKTAAELAESNAVTARNAAQAAQSAAESARNTAISNANLTAQDFIATTADRNTVAADKIIVAADKATVAADKATTLAYLNTTLGYRNDASSSASTATARKNEAEAARDAAVIAQNAAEAASIGIDAIRDECSAFLTDTTIAKDDAEAARDDIDAYLISHTASVVNLTTLFLAYNVYNP
jgi:hypothetical protein